MLAKPLQLQTVRACEKTGCCSERDAVPKKPCRNIGKCRSTGIKIWTGLREEQVTKPMAIVI